MISYAISIYTCLLSHAITPRLLFHLAYYFDAISIGLFPARAATISHSSRYRHARHHFQPHFLFASFASAVYLTDAINTQETSLIKRPTTYAIDALHYSRHQPSLDIPLYALHLYFDLLPSVSLLEPLESALPISAISKIS
jgi:hypothetical protein